jgi:hypothetical protein
MLLVRNGGGHVSVAVVYEKNGDLNECGVQQSSMYNFLAPIWFSLPTTNS